MHIEVNIHDEIVGIIDVDTKETSLPPSVYAIPKNVALPVPKRELFGWRYIAGNFIPPSESHALQKELMSVNSELSLLFQQEQFDNWLGGVANATPRTNALAVGNNRKCALTKRRAEIQARLFELDAEQEGRRGAM